jgi:hypothetical protein
VTTLGGIVTLFRIGHLREALGATTNCSIVDSEKVCSEEKTPIGDVSSKAITNWRVFSMKACYPARRINCQANTLSLTDPAVDNAEDFRLIFSTSFLFSQA